MIASVRNAILDLPIILATHINHEKAVVGGGGRGSLGNLH